MCDIHLSQSSKKLAVGVDVDSVIAINYLRKKKKVNF
jgi:hypothetical protein